MSLVWGVGLNGEDGVMLLSHQRVEVLESHLFDQNTLLCTVGDVQSS